MDCVHCDEGSMCHRSLNGAADAQGWVPGCSDAEGVSAGLPPSPRHPHLPPQTLRAQVMTLGGDKALRPNGS